MYHDLMISVDELWLKGRNRPLYFRALMKHIDQVIKLYHHKKVYSKNDAQRLSYHSDGQPFTMETIQALLKVPGISVISPVRIVERTDDIEADLKKVFEEAVEESSFINENGKTFRVSVKRNDQAYPISSVEVEQRLGKILLDTYPNARAHLKRPEVIIDIRILYKKFSICSQSYRGIGGLPWDTSGHAITMLSGGFDSPVASFMMSKRGMKQSFVFFYAYPFVGEEVVSKIINLTKVLAQYQRQCHLYIVPFGDIQNVISKSCREEYRTLLFRRYMVEAANLICERTGAEAIITGDSLGQVSSQTLTNMTLIDKNSKKLIIRPLVGFNKLEVLKLAETIGTHDISIIPHDDACALFAPQHPVTNASGNYLDLINQELNLETLLNKAIDSAEVYSVNLRGELFKKEFFSFDS